MRPRTGAGLRALPSHVEAGTRLRLIRLAKLTEFRTQNITERLEGSSTSTENGTKPGIGTSTLSFQEHTCKPCSIGAGLTAGGP